MHGQRLEENGPIPTARKGNQNIAVIGGSAAGLFAASLLARRGAGVRVFERIETLEPAARTLIVTHRMRELLGRAAEGSIVNEIRRFELFTDGRAATIALDHPDLIIERRALIQNLAAEAQRAGAKLELGRRFHAMHANGKGPSGKGPRGKGPHEQALTVEVERCADGSREEVHADAIIGGDGAASRVARAAGWAPLETVPLMQAIVPLPKDMPADTVRVWFVPQDTPYFYWLIPESATRGALGVIGESGAETRHHLERFLEKRKLDPIEFQGARIPVYKRWIPVRRAVGGGSVYLVGDAAAQVKVSTVGGIVTGFRGALGVAEAILNGGASRELRTLRRELDFHLLLRRSLHRFQQSDYSRLVDLLNDPAKKSLGEYSRDEAWKMLWRVCLRQPRLVLLGLRGLLMRSKSIDKTRA
ncbi:MAG TPA: NAD(P)/FAD-dependent oxidoreductase [Candidatus Acidoferrales bacterium]|nr:NAD(P)/FAD-dependent oxidoreductase [Candidatus Acidoferrales bacterium]